MRTQPTDQLQLGSWNQCGKPLHELQRAHDQVCGAVLLLGTGQRQPRSFVITRRASVQAWHEK
jgi:hypothetical protein